MPKPTKTNHETSSVAGLRAAADAALETWRGAKAAHAAARETFLAAREAGDENRNPNGGLTRIEDRLAALRAERTVYAAEAELVAAEHVAGAAVDAAELAEAGRDAFDVEALRADLRAELEARDRLEAELAAKKQAVHDRLTAAAASMRVLAQRARVRVSDGLPPPAYAPPPTFGNPFPAHGDMHQILAVEAFARSTPQPRSAPDHADRLLVMRDEERDLLAELERRQRAAEERAAREAAYDRRAAAEAEEAAARQDEHFARAVATRKAEAELASAARERGL